MRSNFGDNRIQGREDQNHWNRKKKKEETVKKESFLMVSRTFGVNHCLVAKMFSKLRIKINNFLKCRFEDFYLDACPLL